MISADEARRLVKLKIIKSIRETIHINAEGGAVSCRVTICNKDDLIDEYCTELTATLERDGYKVRHDYIEGEHILTIWWGLSNYEP